MAAYPYRAILAGTARSEILPGLGNWGPQQHPLDCQLAAETICAVKRLCCTLVGPVLEKA